MCWRRPLLSLVCLAVWSSASAEPTIEPLSMLRGDEANDVLVNSGYAYVATNRGLDVLKLYDVRGRLVRSWAMSARHGTQAEVYWDGTDRHGQKVASGTYFLRARAGNAEASHRMVWMK